MIAADRIVKALPTVDPLTSSSPSGCSTMNVNG